MAPKLGPGERVLFEGHPSWRSILDFYLKGFAATAVLCFLVAVGTGVIGDETNQSAVILVAIAGVGITVLVGFVKRVATSYTITNRRLHIKKGIVSRTIQETRLERVQNVNVTQGVVQRVLQIGDVDFDTAAATTTTSSSPALPSRRTSSRRSTRQLARSRAHTARAGSATSSTATSRRVRRQLRRPPLPVARRPCSSLPR